jgi:predicted MFS family arabinose efflux permease
VRIESLALANTLNGGMLSILHVLGPVLGALLYARSGSLSLVVIIEAIACAGAALLLSLLDQTATQPTLPTVRPAFLTEFWKGVHYVRTTPDLRQILTMLAMSGIANGLFTPLLRPLVEESLHGDDALYAKMFSVFGIGGMLGPLIGFYAGRYFGLGRVLLAAFVIEAVLLTLLSRAHSPQLGTVIMLLWGMNEFAMLPCYMSYVHLRTEPAMMGRTFALFEQVEYIPQLAAAALVGILAGRLPAQGILTVAGVGYLILVMLTLPSQGSRMLAARGHLTSDKDGANGDADS